MGSMPAVGAGVGLEDPGCVESLTDCVGKNCQENLYFGLNQRLVSPQADVPKVPIYYS